MKSNSNHHDSVIQKSWTVKSIDVAAFFFELSSKVRFNLVHEVHVQTANWHCLGPSEHCTILSSCAPFHFLVRLLCSTVSTYPSQCHSSGIQNHFCNSYFGCLLPYVKSYVVIFYRQCLIWRIERTDGWVLNRFYLNSSYSQWESPTHRLERRFWHYGRPHRRIVLELTLTFSSFSSHCLRLP